MQAIIGYIVKAIIDWVMAFFGKLINKKVKQDETQKTSEDSVKPLEEAVTEEDIDKGAKDALDNF